MSLRSRTTLPSEAEVSQEVADSVQELAGCLGALLAFDAKAAIGYHWYMMPGQLGLGEDDEPMHVVLTEAQVAKLTFRNEKDEPFDFQVVATALASKRLRGVQVMERSALLGNPFTTGGADDGLAAAGLSSTLRAVLPRDVCGASASARAGLPGLSVNDSQQPAPAEEGSQVPANADGLSGGLFGRPLQGADASATTLTDPEPGAGSLLSFQGLASPAGRGAEDALEQLQQQLQSAGQFPRLPQSMPPSSSPLMTGRHLGGGDATTRQTSGTMGGALRPSIEEMAAAASAGLLGAARQPEALFEDAVTRPWQCFLWGLSDEDMLEVAPRINAALAVHMDYEIPEYSLNTVGSVLYLQ